MTKRTEWRPNDVPIHQEPWLLIASIAVWWLPLTEYFSPNEHSLIAVWWSAHWLHTVCLLTAHWIFFTDRTQSYHCLITSSLSAYSLLNDYWTECFSPTEHSLITVTVWWPPHWLNTVCLMIASWMFLTGFTTAASVPPWWYKTFRYHVYLNVWVYLLTIEPLTNDIQNSFITASYGIVLYTALLKTNCFYL